MKQSWKDEQSIADKNREDLAGRVLTTNNLVQYREGTVASRMIVFKKTGTGKDRREMIILPANKPHAVFAKERFKMTLTMIRE